MKKSFIYVTILAIFALLTSCSNDDVNGILMPKFTKIEVADNVHVLFLKKDIQNFDVEGRHNLDDYYEVRNNTLYIHNNNHNDNVTVKVGGPDIESLTLRNSSTVEFANDFETYSDNFNLHVLNDAQVVGVGHVKVNTLNIEVRNAGKVAFNNIEANHLNLDQTDGTSAFIEGYARYQDISVNNGAFFNMKRDSEVIDWFRQPNNFQNPVRGEEVKVNIQAGARAWVYAEQKLTGNVNGGSKLYYKGTVDTHSLNVPSGSSIEKK
ncbi:hypothetical protein MY04_2577 [Flammeovirga sp. MY04]|uniref:GIN domain-containing protein n=1 Tax=Flammeovirga sp. MY04 TaxID=1191459 RepID=UPI00080608C5|nr:DUF2807 domain-containing protein [Flammeovirga sp. MY04]ANQ49946.1 hypothetical protein MY04_2577 [Flammeovirga sp. MY04]